MSKVVPKERFMRLAIEKTREGIRNGNSPFGACIVRGDEVVAVDHNVVWQTTDITAHAEITALRHACHTLNTIDLSGCVIYSTTEPCPMCFAACHWARVDAIIFGAEIADAAQAGFHELHVSNEILKETGGSDVEIVRGFMAEECRALSDEWLAQTTKPAY
jgi:tRNA(Arg) A34 adenosine deaminase TadA